MLAGEAHNDSLFGGDGNDVINGGAGVDALFGGADNDTFLFDVAVSDPDVIFDGAFGTSPGGGVADIIRIANAPEAINDFTELMGHAYQDGSDVVVFDADTGIYIKTYTIAQLTKDDTDLWIYLQTGKEALEADFADRVSLRPASHFTRSSPSKAKAGDRSSSDSIRVATIITR